MTGWASDVVAAVRGGAGAGDAGRLGVRLAAAARRPAVACSLLAALLCAAAWRPDVTMCGDDAEYILLSRSLAAGDGLGLYGEPSRYPVAFPALLVLTDWAGIEADKMWAAAAFVAMAALAGLAGGWLAGLGVALSPVLVWLSGQVMPDVLFGLLVLAGLLAVHAYRWWWGLALLMAACALKSAGCVVLLAVLPAALWEGDWRRRAASAALVVPTVLLATTGGYAGQWTAPTLDAALRHLAWYLLQAPEVAAALVLLTLGGSWRLWTVWAVPMLAYLALLAAWPWAAHRFLTPLVPVAWVALVLAWRDPLPWEWFCRWGRWSIRGAQGALLVLCLLSRGVQADELLRPDPTLAPYRAAAEWVRDHVPVTERIWASKPHQVALWSGHRVRRYPYLGVADLQAAAERQDVRWVVLDSWSVASQVCLVPLLRAGGWTPRRDLGEVTVWERVR